MVEAVMYAVIGFLLGCLLALAVYPLVRDRAVRLTMRKVEAALPMSMSEIEIQKDLLRADFAVTVRRLEMRIERLNDTRARLEREASKKSNLFNWIRAQRDALHTEVVDLRAQVDALRKQVPAARPRIDMGAYVARQMVPRRSLRASR